MEKVKNLLPPRPAVARVVADFEAAMWKGILSMFPDVSIQGCCSGTWEEDGGTGDTQVIQKLRL